MHPLTAWNQKNRELGLCIQCGKDKAGSKTLRCPECKAKRRADNLKRGAPGKNRAGKRLRAEVFDRLGRICVCCGEQNPGFLTLDHINGGGHKHRALSAKIKLYRAVLDGEVILQVLCWNCNCGRAFNGGVCPHKDAEKVALATPRSA